MGSERVDIGAGAGGGGGWRFLRQVGSEGVSEGAWGCDGMGLRCGEGKVPLVRWRDSRHAENCGDGSFHLVC